MFGPLAHVRPWSSTRPSQTTDPSLTTRRMRLQEPRLESSEATAGSTSALNVPRGGRSLTGVPPKGPAPEVVGFQEIDEMGVRTQGCTLTAEVCTDPDLIDLEVLRKGKAPYRTFETVESDCTPPLRPDHCSTVATKTVHSVRVRATLANRWTANTRARHCSTVSTRTRQPVWPKRTAPNRPTEANNDRD